METGYPLLCSLEPTTGLYSEPIHPVHTSPICFVDPVSYNLPSHICVFQVAFKTLYAFLFSCMGATCPANLILLTLMSFVIKYSNDVK